MDATEADVLPLVAPFGTAEKILILRSKLQVRALLLLIVAVM